MTYYGDTAHRIAEVLRGAPDDPKCLLAGVGSVMGARAVCVVRPSATRVMSDGAWLVDGEWQHRTRVLSGFAPEEMSTIEAVEAATLGAEALSIPAERKWGCGRSAISPLILAVGGVPFARSLDVDRLATAVDIVITRIAASAQARLTGVLQERARIASDIHEGVAQELATLSLQLEVLAQLMTEAPQVSELAGLTRATTHRAIESIREAILDLGPPRQGPGGLGEGMQDFVADFGGRWALDISFAVDGPQQAVEPDSLELVYSFLQEALTNLRKYSSTLKGDVRVVFADQVLSVKVRSDGRSDGTASSTVSTGQGLQLMTSRARLLGGEVSADVDSNGGREVVLQIPI